MSCDDVRDFNDGKNDHYVVKDKEVIQHFVNALSLIQFKFIMTKEKSDTRMVLDFYSSDERIKEIGLNSRGAVFAEKNLYRSMALYYLIEKEIPKTTAPY